jgi:uncharacterized protein YjbI with pentapeptide repeats
MHSNDNNITWSSTNIPSAGTYDFIIKGGRNEMKFQLNVIENTTIALKSTGTVEGWPLTLSSTNTNITIPSTLGSYTLEVKYGNTIRGIYNLHIVKTLANIFKQGTDDFPTNQTLFYTLTKQQATSGLVWSSENLPESGDYDFVIQLYNPETNIYDEIKRIKLHITDGQTSKLPEGYKIIDNKIIGPNVITRNADFRNVDMSSVSTIGIKPLPRTSHMDFSNILRDNNGNISLDDKGYAFNKVNGNAYEIIFAANQNNLISFDMEDFISDDYSIGSIYRKNTSTYPKNLYNAYYRLRESRSSGFTWGSSYIPAPGEYDFVISNMYNSKVLCKMNLIVHDFVLYPEPLLSSGSVIRNGYLLTNGIDLRSVNLDGADISGLTLERLNLSGSILRNVNFTDTNLLNSDFSNTRIENTNFTDTNMMGVNFVGTKIDGINISGANLSGLVTYEEPLGNAVVRMSAINVVTNGQTTLPNNAIVIDGTNINGGTDINGFYIGPGAQYTIGDYNDTIIDFKDVVLNGVDFSGVIGEIFVNLKQSFNSNLKTDNYTKLPGGITVSGGIFASAMKINDADVLPNQDTGIISISSNNTAALWDLRGTNVNGVEYLGASLNTDNNTNISSLGSSRRIDKDGYLVYDNGEKVELKWNPSKEISLQQSMYMFGNKQLNSDTRIYANDDVDYRANIYRPKTGELISTNINDLEYFNLQSTTIVNDINYPHDRASGKQKYKPSPDHGGHLDWEHTKVISVKLRYYPRNGQPFGDASFNAPSDAYWWDDPIEYEFNRQVLSVYDEVWYGPNNANLGDIDHTSPKINVNTNSTVTWAPTSWGELVVDGIGESNTYTTRIHMSKSIDDTLLTSNDHAVNNSYYSVSLKTRDSDPAPSIRWSLNYLPDLDTPGYSHTSGYQHNIKVEYNYTALYTVEYFRVQYNNGTYYFRHSPAYGRRRPTFMLTYSTFGNILTRNDINTLYTDTTYVICVLEFPGNRWGKVTSVQTAKVVVDGQNFDGIFKDAINNEEYGYKFVGDENKVQIRYNSNFYYIHHRSGNNSYYEQLKLVEEDSKPEWGFKSFTRTSLENLPPSKIIGPVYFPYPTKSNTLISIDQDGNMEFKDDVTITSTTYHNYQKTDTKSATAICRAYYKEIQVYLHVWQLRYTARPFGTSLLDYLTIFPNYVYSPDISYKLKWINNGSELQDIPTTNFQTDIVQDHQDSSKTIPKHIVRYGRLWGYTVHIKGTKDNPVVLKDMDLSGINMSFMEYDHVYFENVNMRGVNLSYARFTNVTLIHTDMRDAVLNNFISRNVHQHDTQTIKIDLVDYTTNTINTTTDMHGINRVSKFVINKTIYWHSGQDNTIIFENYSSAVKYIVPDISELNITMIGRTTTIYEWYRLTQDRMDNGLTWASEYLPAPGEYWLSIDRGQDPDSSDPDSREWSKFQLIIPLVISNGTQLSNDITISNNSIMSAGVNISNMNLTNINLENIDLTGVVARNLQLTMPTQVNTFLPFSVFDIASDGYLEINQKRYRFVFDKSTDAVIKYINDPRFTGDYSWIAIYNTGTTDYATIPTGGNSWDWIRSSSDELSWGKNYIPSTIGLYDFVIYPDDNDTSVYYRIEMEVIDSSAPVSKSKMHILLGQLDNTNLSLGGYSKLNNQDYEITMIDGIDHIITYDLTSYIDTNSTTYGNIYNTGTTNYAITDSYYGMNEFRSKNGLEWGSAYIPSEGTYDFVITLNDVVQARIKLKVVSYDATSVIPFDKIVVTDAGIKTDILGYAVDENGDRVTIRFKNGVNNTFTYDNTNTLLTANTKSWIYIPGTFKVAVSESWYWMYKNEESTPTSITWGANYIPPVGTYDFVISEYDEISGGNVIKAKMVLNVIDNNLETKLPNGFISFNNSIIGPGIDLSGLDLRGLDLSNMDMSRANLVNSDLRGCRLDKIRSVDVIADATTQLPIGYSIIGGVIYGPDINFTAFDASTMNLEGADVIEVHGRSEQYPESTTTIDFEKLFVPQGATGQFGTNSKQIAPGFERIDIDDDAITTFTAELSHIDTRNISRQRDKTGYSLYKHSDGSYKQVTFTLDPLKSKYTISTDTQVAMYVCYPNSQEFVNNFTQAAKMDYIWSDNCIPVGTWDLAIKYGDTSGNYINDYVKCKLIVLSPFRYNGNFPDREPWVYGKYLENDRDVVINNDVTNNVRKERIKIALVIDKNNEISWSTSHEHSWSWGVSSYSATRSLGKAALTTKANFVLRDFEKNALDQEAQNKTEDNTWWTPTFNGQFYTSEMGTWTAADDGNVISINPSVGNNDHVLVIHNGNSSIYQFAKAVEIVYINSSVLDTDITNPHGYSNAPLSYTLNVANIYGTQNGYETVFDRLKPLVWGANQENILYVNDGVANQDGVAIYNKGTSDYPSIPAGSDWSPLYYHTTNSQISWSANFLPEVGEYDLVLFKLEDNAHVEKKRIPLYVVNDLETVSMNLSLSQDSKLLMKYDKENNGSIITIKDIDFVLDESGILIIDTTNLPSNTYTLSYNKSESESSIFSFQIIYNFRSIGSDDTYQRTNTDGYTLNYATGHPYEVVFKANEENVINYNIRYTSDYSYLNIYERGTTNYAKDQDGNVIQYLYYQLGSSGNLTWETAFVPPPGEYDMVYEADYNYNSNMIQLKFKLTVYDYNNDWNRYYWIGLAWYRSSKTTNQGCCFGKFSI